MFDAEHSLDRAARLVNRLLEEAGNGAAVRDSRQSSV